SVLRFFSTSSEGSVSRISFPPASGRNFTSILFRLTQTKATAMREQWCRTKIIKFDGCYHGHVDGLLVKTGSGVATLGLPDSPGVPPGFARETLVATFNDVDSVETAYQMHITSVVHWSAGIHPRIYC